MATSSFSYCVCRQYQSVFGADTLFGFFSKDFNPAPLIPIDSAHPGQIEAALKYIHEQSIAQLSKLGHAGKQLQLLIIILPEVSGSYGKSLKLALGLWQ